MLCDVTLEAEPARFLFYAVPIITVGASIMLYVIHSRLASAGKKSWLAWLIQPPGIHPLVPSKQYLQTMASFSPSRFTGVPPGKAKVKFRLSQIAWRLLFFIVLAAIVFASAILSVLFHEVGHGIVGEAVGATWYHIEIGIFTGLCSVQLPYPTGSLSLWYAGRLWISAGGVLVAGIVGIVFLAFLVIPHVRNSFYASLFCFANGIVSTTYGIEAWYGEAWNMVYGTPLDYSDLTSIMTFQEYLGLNITPGLVLDVMIVFLVAIQIVLIIVGGKLWRIHYAYHRFSHVWFISLIELVWWYFLFSAIAFN